MDSNEAGVTSETNESLLDNISDTNESSLDSGGDLSSRSTDQDDLILKHFDRSLNHSKSKSLPRPMTGMTSSYYDVIIMTHL